MEKALLTVKELASTLNMGRDKAYALMHAKGFPSIKIGGRYYVSSSALERWIEQYEYKSFVL